MILIQSKHWLGKDLMHKSHSFENVCPLQRAESEKWTLRAQDTVYHYFSTFESNSLFRSSYLPNFHWAQSFGGNIHQHGGNLWSKS